MTQRVIRRPRPAARSQGCVVGLDPSLTGYGIVLLQRDGTLLADQLVTTKAGKTYAARLVAIREAIVATLEHRSVDIVVMERPAYAASGAFTGGLVHAATAFAMVDLYGLEDRRVAPVLVATNTLKKFVTGKGNGPKSVIIKGVYKRWGYDTDDDNLADAYGLARLGAAVLSGGSELKYEQDCIATLRRSMSWEPLPPQSNPSSRPTQLPEGSRSSVRGRKK